MTIQPFHLAIPVNDLEKSASFYAEVLGLEQGRRSTHWIDYNFYGHQFVLHEVKDYKTQNHFNSVDENEVPVPHFGVVLLWKDFWDLSDRLKSFNVQFQIEPNIRFEGKTGEQATLFFYDPSGNALEFKAFKNPDDIFNS